ncbi:LLM class flavin-dependent oxidoreductase [Dictyobacter formicarum]|uniref:Luciferase-like protein n=1 Tax=Dictyobacter formicarum TaxID=2778368 RepID=A0ABQ3VMG1_9CHLR|nr:LLM class flavin-dependent oxidoreductase [Dictyobacter formicarum]GHO87402.1 luciferase-like protein [Dictyobacter formicarum]
MKYGVTLPLSGIDGDLERLVEYARIAEEAGWDGVFLEDYMVYWGEHNVTYDPWLTLAAIALRTQNVQLGITVTPLPSRLPWKLAREAITLDHLSHGRLIIGFGLGDAQDRHFGEVADEKQRGAMLDEGLEILAGLMSGQPYSYQGTYYTVNDVTFNPQPVQRPRIPIWIGGWWPRKAPALRAARWDGFCPAKVPDAQGDGSIKPHDIQAIHNFVSAHRTSDTPFDLVAAGNSAADDRARARAQIEPFESAGATWWVEFILPGPNESEQAFTRIKQGPPSLE